MPNILKTIAQQATTLSELMENREKIETEEIIKYHEKGIHINDIDPQTFTDAKGNPSDTYVFTFDEAKDKFAFAGHVLCKIFDAVIKECDGDLDAARELFKKEKLHVKLSTGKTKAKREVTLVEVL